MCARSIGEIAGLAVAAKSRRTFQPVRRDSHYAGEREHRVWRPIGRTPKEARKLIAVRLQAAEHYELANKEPGKSNGPLGGIGLEVLRVLYRMVDYRTGRLDPAIATICQRIRRSRGAVVAALKRLKAHGFLDWVRRAEPTHNEGAGPQVRQISNAYGFGLPARAAAWVKRKLASPPPPDCELARPGKRWRRCSRLYRWQSRLASLLAMVTWEMSSPASVLLSKGARVQVQT
jgi:hypothetical protein